MTDSLGVVAAIHGRTTTVTGPTVWTYDIRTPHAVVVDFTAMGEPDDDGTREIVVWAFARELLREGLWQSAGEPHGDVRVTAAPKAGVLVLALSGVEGACDVFFDLAPVVEFLRATTRYVGYGREGDRIDWAAETRQIGGDW